MSFRISTIKNRYNVCENPYQTFRTVIESLHLQAAGGYTRVYKVSSSRVSENCGEGIILAYEAGADLVDMEMVRFHPAAGDRSNPWRRRHITEFKRRKIYEKLLS